MAISPAETLSSCKALSIFAEKHSCIHSSPGHGSKLTQPTRGCRYFVFAASLVILMNQFSSLYHTKDYAKTMADAIDIMEYCAKTDSQAERVLDIISRFSKVVNKWTRDHTYSAPELSDFSCLRRQAARSGPSAEHTKPRHAGLTLQDQGPSRAVNVPDPGLLTPPTVPKLPLLGILSTQSPGAVPEGRVNVMSPLHTGFPQVSLVGAAPSVVSGHSSRTSAEPLSGNVEFEFDGLWNSFINYLPPVSTVAPGIGSLMPQFPPPVIGTPTEPFGRCYEYSDSAGSQMPLTDTHGALFRQARFLNGPLRAHASLCRQAIMHWRLRMKGLKISRNRPSRSQDRTNGYL